MHRFASIGIHYSGRPIKGNFPRRWKVVCSLPLHSRPGNDRSIINGERRGLVLFLSTSPNPANCPSRGESFENRGFLPLLLFLFLSVCLSLVRLLTDLTEDSHRDGDNGGRDKKFTKHTSRATGSRARAGQGTMLSLEVCRAATSGLPQWGLESGGNQG